MLGCIWGTVYEMMHKPSRIFQFDNSAAVKTWVLIFYSVNNIYFQLRVGTNSYKIYVILSETGIR